MLVLFLILMILKATIGEFQSEELALEEMKLEFPPSKHRGDPSILVPGAAIPRPRPRPLSTRRPQNHHAP